MATRQKLLEARQSLAVAIRASEDWQPSYKKDRDNFKALLRYEAELETAVAEYLYQASERVDTYVDWSKLPAPVQADSTPILRNSDPAWGVEQKLLSDAIMDAITMLVLTGGHAGELAYGIDLGLDPLHKQVLTAARKHVAQLVSGVTDTTRDLIRESVRQSIERGEDVTAAVERLRKTINNPVRAELIARTESVNAYQTGLANFASETGAVSKEWESLAGACKVCSPMNGQTVTIDKSFVLPNGHEVMQPTAHPRCKCSLIYNY